MFLLVISVNHTNYVFKVFQRILLLGKSPLSQGDNGHGIRQFSSNTLLSKNDTNNTNKMYCFLDHENCNNHSDAVIQSIPHDMSSSMQQVPNKLMTTITRPVAIV